MKKTIVLTALFVMLAVSSTSVMAKGLMEGFSDSSSSKNPEMPDPRIGRPSRPPTPRASGNTHTNSVGMKFTLVQPGTVVLGEKETSITRAVYVGADLVTERQWAAVMGMPVTDIPGWNRSDSLGIDGPVRSVNWNDTQDFINKLNEKEGTNRYRLATEAEWMRAMRSGFRIQNNNPEWMYDGYDKDYYSRLPAADPWGPVEDYYKLVRRADNLDAVYRYYDKAFERPSNTKPSLPGFHVVLDTDHPGEKPAGPQRQFTVEAIPAAQNRRYPNPSISTYADEWVYWSKSPVRVSVNGGPAQVIMSLGPLQTSRTFTASVGDKVQVLWDIDNRSLTESEVYVYYTDTPVRNVRDEAAKLIGSSERKRKFVIGDFTVTARGTPNNITNLITGNPPFNGKAVPPGEYTVEAISSSSTEKNWTWDHGAIFVSVNGQFPRTLVEQPYRIGILLPKVTFTVRAGEQVRVIWAGGSYANYRHVIVYRSDRPASGIDDTANVLGAVRFGAAANGKDNVIVDLNVR